MAKSFLVSPGRAYLVIAEEGTNIVRTNGTLIDTVPEGANAVSITVDTHEIIVMDNAAKIQQLYNGNSGSSGIMTIADGEDAGSWQIEIVSSLPEQGSAGIIYMLRTNRTGTDRYDDYIWIPEDNAYELLGRRPESTSVDLSNVAKTDVANTFTKSQQINGTLTATTVNVASLSCDQSADIGAATVNDLDYNTASGSSMTVSHVTILSSLNVDSQAAVELPGVTWRTGTSGDYIDVTRKILANAVEISGAAKVSNVLTLGKGNIELNGHSGTVKVADTTSSVIMATSSIRALSQDATLLLQGNKIRIQTTAGNRTVFSVAQNTDEKFILSVSDGATLDGTVSMPGTLTVNNLNVTGTVTGITTGGDTPTVDFSNGVTIMQTLTADDVVADTVTASTLSADSSVSVDSEPVIYRHSDGAMYVQGDVVNATRVVATTFLPTNIQGATFTGPLDMTTDNAIRVFSQGVTAEICNGNLTGFSYAQIGQCSIMQSLTTDQGKARSVTITDTLVVKDLVVTGTNADIPHLTMEEGTAQSVTITDTLVVNDLVVTGTTTGVPGVVDGDLQVSGAVAAASVSADSVSTDRIGAKGTGVLSVMSSLVATEDLTVRGSLFAEGIVSARTVSAIAVLADSVEADSLKVVVPSTTTSPASIYELRSDSNAEMLELVAYNNTSSQSTRIATLRVPTLCVRSITGPEDTSVLSVMSSLCAHQGVTVMTDLTVGDSLIVGSSQSYMYVDNSGNVQVNTLSVMHTISASEATADSITVGNKLTTANLVVDGVLATVEEEVQTTQAGTADAYCRWAQIGSSHNMLAKGRLKYVDIPGPSVQKLPSAVSSASFVLSLWYQADSSGSDIRFIGKSTNAVTPAAGTTTSNRWNFTDVEITDDHLGRNVRLLMIDKSHTVPSTWAEAVDVSYSSTSYIQGRYITESTDADCLVSAADSGNMIYNTILTTEFACDVDTPGYLLTDEQKELLDWLAANKDALSNLISSASA